MAHTIEVAKSGRSQCRGCKKKIEKGVLRFGEEVPNMFSEDGGTTFRMTLKIMNTEDLIESV